MTFDILSYTQDELDKLSTIQMQLLRTAQKKKNELQYKMEQELEMFRIILFTDDMMASSLYNQKKAELNADFERQVEILREQLIYSMELNEPFPEGGGSGSEDVGYIVDYSLSYVDRYAIVREYYLSIEDPVERMNLYSNDEVARRYLGNYYTTLYNVLYTYSQ